MSEAVHADVGAAPQRDSTLVVLRRNPDLAKAIAASGLQRATLMVNGQLGVNNLRAMVWGTHTAAYTAQLSMGLSVLAMLSAGHFGRMGDRLGRRTAAAVFGATSFLPSWVLLACGFNEVGLYASSAALVLSGVGLCSDAVLVLASEVTREEDRGMAYGLYQAGTNGIAFALFGLPSALTILFGVLPDPPIQVWQWYTCALSVLYFVAVYLIRSTPVGSASASSSRDGEPEAALPPQIVEAKSNRRCFRRIVMSIPLVRELHLISGCPSLRRLYATGALLAFSGDVVFDIGSQYFRDSLDLIAADDTPHEERMAHLKDQQLVSVLSTLPPELVLIPTAMLVGLAAKRLGSKKLLQIMIPMSACMTAAGAMMAAVPRYWVVPLVCIFLNFASLTSNVPLKHLLTATAPADRIGEAMATLGMLNQAVSFVANAVVAVATPLLYEALPKPLWIVYLFAGALTLMGSITIRGLEMQTPEAGAKAVAEDLGGEPGEQPHRAASSGDLAGRCTAKTPCAVARRASTATMMTAASTLVPSCCSAASLDSEAGLETPRSPMPAESVLGGCSRESPLASLRPASTHAENALQGTARPQARVEASVELQA